MYHQPRGHFLIPLARSIPARSPASTPSLACRREGISREILETLYKVNNDPLKYSDPNPWNLESVTLHGKMGFAGMIKLKLLS